MNSDDNTTEVEESGSVWESLEVKFAFEGQGLGDFDPLLDTPDPGELGYW